MSDMGYCPVEACPNLGTLQPLTKHHVFPLRWYNHFKRQVNKDYINSIFKLCRACHDRLEKLIEEAEMYEAIKQGKREKNARVPKSWLWYPYIVREFQLIHGHRA